MLIVSFPVRKALPMFISIQKSQFSQMGLDSQLLGFQKRYIRFPKSPRRLRVKHEKHGQWWALQLLETLLLFKLRGLTNPVQLVCFFE
jgi:hypothetical protein